MVATIEDRVSETRPTTGETVSGEVEKVIYSAEDTGYVIFTIAHEDGRRTSSLTVLGHFPGLQEGAHISADGKFAYDPKRGKQFKADLIRFTPPSSVHGIERYLSSGLIKGIGPVLAKRITERFGEKTLDVMEHESARLREVDGVGTEKLACIRTAWKEHTEMRNLMVFLQQYGISTTKAGRIVKKYGDAAIATITEDPYCLCRDIDGIGFLTADKAALAMSIPRHSFKRRGAGVIHVLEEAKSEGHCALPPSLVIERGVKLLELDANLVADALDTLVMEQQLHKDTVSGRELIYLPYMRAYERTIAALLRRFTDMGESPYAPGASEDRITEAEQEIGKKLAPAQRAALVQSLKHRVSVITGGPGSGKSTLLGALRHIFKALNAKIVLAAPTGRAAKRMSETTGIEAKTIHRLLAFDPQSGEFVHNAKNPLAGDVFVVDEASMLDVPLAFKLLRAIPKQAHVIFVGDKDQLPSVGPGSFLADMIHSQAVPTTYLREIFRQAASSKIITNAHCVNAGSMPENGGPGDDFFFVSQTDPEQIKAMMRKIVTERIPQVFKLDPLKDVQVLAPMHKGPLGIKELNNFFQDILNPHRGGPTYDHAGHQYRVGDKVLQLRNNYDLDVFNGDMGFIQDINPREKTAVICFDGVPTTFRFTDFADLTLAYVTSIHKSQGSEFPAVIMPMVKGYYHMLQKNLVYTGITRGKKLVVMVGDKAALAMAVRNNKPNERHGGLIYRLSASTMDWLEEELLAK